MTSSPAASRRSRRGAAILVVVALVAGLAIVTVVRARAAAASAFEAATAAHEDGDCASAIDGYAEAQRSRWSRSPVVAPAKERTEECQAYLVPEEAEAAENWQAAIEGYDDYLTTYRGSLLDGRASEARNRAFEALTVEELDAVDAMAAAADSPRDWRDALDGYDEHLADHPDGPLVPRATEARAIAYRSLATAELDAANALVAAADGRVGGYESAVTQYLQLLRAYPDTEAAAQVPQAITAAYDSGAGLLAQQRWCDAVAVLDVFAVDRPEPLPVPDLAGRAQAALPQALYECGLQRFAEGDFQAAITELRRLGDTYPDNPLAGQARPTLIRAEVADITNASAGEVPPPSAVGRAAAGTVEVEVINDSPEQLEVLFAGPDADAITIPPCTTCTTYPFQPPGACVAGSLPTVSLDLPPGSYQLGVRASSGSEVVPYSGTWELASGTAYSSCFFIVTSFG